MEGETAQVDQMPHGRMHASFGNHGTAVRVTEQHNLCQPVEFRGHPRRIPMEIGEWSAVTAVARQIDGDRVHVSRG